MASSRSRHVRIGEREQRQADRVAALEARLAELEAWKASVEPEVVRLATIAPQWPLIERALEHRGGFSTVAEAERVMGEGVQLADASGKPRDSEATKSVLKHVDGANLGVLKEQRARVLEQQGEP